jgi:hypothetical protein
MALGDRKSPEQTNQALSPPTPIVQENGTPTKRVLITSLLAGVIGGGAGLVSKHRIAHPNIPTVYAANFAIVAGCYCGTCSFPSVLSRLKLSVSIFSKKVDSHVM